MRTHTHTLPHIRPSTSHPIPPEPPFDTDELMEEVGKLDGVGEGTELFKSIQETIQTLSAKRRKVV